MIVEHYTEMGRMPGMDRYDLRIIRYTVLDAPDDNPRQAEHLRTQTDILTTNGSWRRYEQGTQYQDDDKLFSLSGTVRRDPATVDAIVDLMSGMQGSKFRRVMKVLFYNGFHHGWHIGDQPHKR